MPCHGQCAGLSPRVRGNRWVLRVFFLRGGSIPACAGEPPWFRGQGGSDKVYPRVCGGTLGVRPARIPWWGLSPRVRGNRRVSSRERVSMRSIPACAGEPALNQIPPDYIRVYPRVCGGTVVSRVWKDARGGLSPRVRGNLTMWICRFQPIRSIPACAGEPHVRELEAEER